MAVRRGRRPRPPRRTCPSPPTTGAIGGLGLHMARKMSASMDYRYDQGENRLVIDFDLEG